MNSGRFAILSKAAVLATLFASSQLFAYGGHTRGLTVLDVMTHTTQKR